ncbi:MAG: hypothetical protein M5U31_14965 [Acidimicrobiia bacterium]|nr:hypothetical protein [Acidimicrobiia bacterium]
MSRALQCPVCGHKHPVAELPEAPTFECWECGRILKVPRQQRQASSADSPRSSSSADSTTLLPNHGRGPDAPRSGGRAPAEVEVERSPAWFRVVAWLLAIPIAAVVVFGTANVFGMLTGSQLTDMFLEARVTAYGRLALLLPLWALVVAGVVQLLDLLWARRSRRREAAES